MGKESKINVLTMKQTIISYMDMWLTYYDVPESSRVLVMNKIDELFEVYDTVIGKKIKKVWKDNRTSSKSD
tara:strand:+ start:500 stop:712 length:213 start_codon:yes stop_codon:yes gene_type:complete